jgi:RND family efflux transporter MFP subunit
LTNSNAQQPASEKLPGSFISRHKKLTVVLVILAAATIVRLMTGQASPFGRPDGPEPVYVELGSATFGTMRELGRYYGSLSAPHKFTLASKASGEITSLLADIGDKLAAGQVVATLDDEEYVLVRDRATLSVRLAEAQVNEAKANLELADSDLRRQTSLTKKSIVTQSDFEAAENRRLQAVARLQVAESQLQSASNQLADAELRLSYTRVVASWPEASLGGPRYVGSRLVDEGQLVTANTPLFELVSLDPLLVVVDVIEKDYPKFSVGMEARLSTEAFPGQTFTAKVLRVAPVLSSDSRQARLELEVANPSLLLKPGMYADVVFVFNERQNVWSVAEDVPFRRQDGFVIFEADSETGTVSQVRVNLGLVEDGRVELVDADPINKRVVTLGQHLLQDGQNFRVAGDNLPAVPQISASQVGGDS